MTAEASASDTSDWHARAQHFLDEGNPGAAHRVAVEAVAAHPGNALAWTLRGQASALLGNYADAEYELAESSRLDPTSSFSIYVLGDVYAAQEKWEQAMARYDAALSISPDHPDVLSSKAKVLLATDRPQAAVKLMKPVVERHPNDKDHLRTLAGAYHDTALEKLTFVPDHGYVWTEERHLSHLESAAYQIEQLRSKDSEVIELARNLRAMADEGRQLHWDTSAPNLFFWLGGLVFLCVCGAITGTGNIGAGIFVGLLVAGGVAGGLFALIRRKPAWKIAQEQLGKGNFTQRAMNVANRTSAAVFRVFDS